jgi:hypothetical protein
MGAHDIIAHPVHLGPGGKAEVEQFLAVAMNWYEEYISRHAEDGAEGRSREYAQIQRFVGDVGNASAWKRSRSMHLRINDSPSKES